jgi:hypothetical protein
VSGRDTEPQTASRTSRKRFAETVLPGLRALDGFLDATVLVRSCGDETEAVVATVWESVGAVKAFAGDDHERAVIEPIVSDLLTRFDEHVTHFTLALAVHPLVVRTRR